MRYNNIGELEKDYCKLADEGDFKGALDLIERASELLPKEEFETEFYYIMMDKCFLASKCKIFQKIIEIFLEGTDRGYLCPIQMQMFRGILECEGYKELKEKTDLLLDKLQKDSKYKYEVYVPKNYDKDKKYPLFLNLHGDGDNLEYHKKYWSPDFLLRKGFIVVYPQASQISHHSAYKWVTREFYDAPKVEWSNPTLYSLAYEDIKTIYNEVTQKYSIDQGNIVIGGFSGGATASIDMAIANIVPAKGCIAICSMKPEVFKDETIREISKRGTKFIFMEGEKDVPVADVDLMINMCKENSVPCEYYINKGVGHWYPENLDEKLDRALNFIMK